jgi:hypothetical protein
VTYVKVRSQHQPARQVIDEKVNFEVNNFIMLMKSNNSLSTCHVRVVCERFACHILDTK